MNVTYPILFMYGALLLLLPASPHAGMGDVGYEGSCYGAAFIYADCDGDGGFSKTVTFEMSSVAATLALFIPAQMLRFAYCAQWILAGKVGHS